jgi:RNA polymerase sigma-70 factor (ECF subfamily)
VSLDSLALAGPQVEAVEWTVRDVYVHNGAFLWRSLQRLGVPDAALDDCLQEVLIVVHRRLDSFDPSRAKLTTWLFGICLRIAKLHRRRSARRREIPEGVLVEPPRPAAGETPEDALGRAELRGQIERVLAAMDIEKRAALVLYEVDGIKTDAIAELMGVPVGTIHSRLHAARKQFKKKLEADRRRGASPALARTAAVAPLSVSELLDALPPPTPVPPEVHARTLAHATELASGATAPLFSLLGGKALATLLTAGAAATVIAMGVHDAPTRGAPVAEPARTEPARAEVTPVRAAATRSATAPAPAPVRPSPPSPEPSIVALADLPSAPVIQGDMARAPDAPRPRGDLAEEAARVAAARRQLAVDPARALELSREYTARFPHGQLASANHWIAVEALRRLGRLEQASAQAGALAAADPTGLFAPQANEIAGGAPSAAASE